LQNLLNWSRTQLGQLQIHNDNVNLKQIIQNTTDLLNNQARLKNISIINDSPDDVFVTTDMNVLSTILRNFISNAIKFSHNGSQIQIHTFTQNGSAKISVIDSGIGISEADVEKLFNLAVKFTTYGTAKEKGTGLGLILVKELADKIDGHLEVESKIGEGSTFSIVLPRERNN
jgi:signal transduction histidine kinase